MSFTKWIRADSSKTEPRRGDLFLMKKKKKKVSLSLLRKEKHGKEKKKRRAGLEERKGSGGWIEK